MVPGTGGIGVAGANLTIVNSGTIAGGLSGGAAPVRADAINFYGGTNSLTITSTSSITGRVAAFSTADTFGLGGSANATFDASQLGATGSSAQYQGFGILQKSGASTWTLIGTPGTALSYQFVDGTLSLGSSGALGTTGSISFTGGTLQYTGANQTDYSARFSNAAGQAYRIDTNGQVVTFATALTSPGGSLTKLGTGTLALTSANTYTGVTAVNGGTLRGGAANAFSPTSATSIAAGGTLDLGG